MVVTGGIVFILNTPDSGTAFRLVLARFRNSRSLTLCGSSIVLPGRPSSQSRDTVPVPVLVFALPRRPPDIALCDGLGAEESLENPSFIKIDKSRQLRDFLKRPFLAILFCTVRHSNISCREEKFGDVMSRG